MTRFFGKHICGVRGGDSFAKVARPLITTNQCPEGTVPCSKITSLENTLCYPEKDREALCPITDIVFVDKKETENFAKASYEIQKLYGDSYLAYSRIADSLPITTTRVEAKPCVMPNEVSFNG